MFNRKKKNLISARVGYNVNHEINYDDNTFNNYISKLKKFSDDLNSENDNLLPTKVIKNKNETYSVIFYYNINKNIHIEFLDNFRKFKVYFIKDTKKYYKYIRNITKKKSKIKLNSYDLVNHYGIKYHCFYVNDINMIFYYISFILGLEIDEEFLKNFENSKEDLDFDDIINEIDRLAKEHTTKLKNDYITNFLMDTVYKVVEDMD